MANEMVISQIKQRLELLWQAVEKLEGGGDTPSGTSDYDDLSNKPQINGTTLSGNKTASDLGLATSTVVSEISALVEALDGDNEALQTAVEGKADASDIPSTSDIENIVDGVLADLDVSDVGGSTKYITIVGQTDGLLTATSETSDSAPTTGSTKLVQSGGVYNALANKIEASSYGSQATGGTVRVWTTTSGSDTILNIATQDPS